MCQELGQTHRRLRSLAKLNEILRKLPFARACAGVPRILGSKQEGGAWFVLVKKIDMQHPAILYCTRRARARECNTSSTGREKGLATIIP
jgi:hypothetical protein